MVAFEPMGVDVDFLAARFLERPIVPGISEQAVSN